jgi:hypothetical protein
MTRQSKPKTASPDATTSAASGVVTLGKWLGISDISIPDEWPSVPNPFASLAQRTSQDLVLHLGLLPATPAALRRYEASNFALLGAHAYPRVEIGRFRLCNDWANWLFFFAAKTDEQPDLGALERRMERCLTVLRTGRIDGQVSPIEQFMLDIRLRMAHLASDRWLAAFARDVEDHLLRGALPAARHCHHRTIAGLAEHPLQRVHESGVLTSLDLTEIVCAGQELPQEVRASSELQDLRYLCARVVAFVHDVFAFERGALAQSNPNNLVRVLMHHRNLEPDAAVSDAVALINDDVAAYQAAEQTFMRDASALTPAVRVYLEGLRARMRGNLIWSLQTGCRALD